MIPLAEDRAAVRGAGRGDDGPRAPPVSPEGVAHLFHEHHRSLYRYLVRLTDDRALAEDVVQETFLRMLERPPADLDPRAWLFRVATNAVRDRGRRERRHQELLAAGTDRVPGPRPLVPPDRLFERRRAAERVREGLDSLSSRDRTILLMREEGFTHREIAEAVGTTTGSVGTMIARALDKLARALELDGRR